MAIIFSKKIKTQSQNTPIQKTGGTVMSKIENLINKNQKRARVIQGWCIAGLFGSILLYLAFHFWIFDPKGGEGLVWYGITTKSGISERATDWTLWGLIGTFIYLLTEITSHYRKIEKNAPRKHSFLDFTPWYVSTLLKSPFIVLVIMLFFNAANLKLTGTDNSNGAISFQFSELDHRVSVTVAFVLGYYSRVGRSVLDNIVKSLLPKAWAEANQSFEISPKNAQVVIGESAIFQTSPKMDVVWATTLGTIDPTGKYTPSENKDDCNKTAVITAVTSGTQAIARSASVEVLPFRIDIEPRCKSIDHGADYTFTAPPAYAVEWKSTNGTLNKNNGNFTSDLDPQIEEVTITARIIKGEMKDKYGKLTLKYK